jgi:sortase A
MISGLLLVIFSLTVFLATFFPVLHAQLLYILNKSDSDAVVLAKGEKSQSQKVINPKDEEFGIVIPKINANAKVIANVDPYDSNVYQEALTKGVAHAKGSGLPDKFGNTFIFSHSSVNFYEALRYNSVFYLLGKLEKGDAVYLFYKGKKYTYRVKDKKTVEPEEISYLENIRGSKTLTLMTCTPPGTTFKRLVVIAALE